MKRPALLVLALFYLTAHMELKAESPIVNGQNSDLVFISGGTFTMGSPGFETGRSDREGPQHQVTVSSFYMGKYAVTQDEYLRIMGRNPSRIRGQDLPIDHVSWFDAINYCNTRSLEEGLTPAYTRNGNNVVWDRSANGYRLPTEAEWEYACRAGSVTPFYSGFSVDTAGWHSGNSGGRVHPVGQKESNLWGLYDMHGNVLEWCWDWLGDYTNETKIDPEGPPSGSARVYRGGTFLFESGLLRSAYRFGNNPNLRINLVGFRVVRSAE